MYGAGVPATAPAVPMFPLPVALLTDPPALLLPTDPLGV